MNPFSLVNCRWVDLSHSIHEGMQTFPVHWHAVTEITQLGRHGIEDRETRRLTIGTHSGTHIDAPRHFIPGGPTIEQIALDVLCGPAVLIDFSEAGKNQEIGVEALASALGEARPERIVLRFDWCRHWGANRFYTDHPFLSEEAARWLVDRGVRVLGMDTPQVDSPFNGRGSANDSPVHKIMLGAGVVFVEYLANLGEIGARDFELVVMPLKILGSDGAPCRVAARVTNKIA